MIISIGEIAKVGAGQSAPQNAEAFSNNGTPFIRAGSLEFLSKGASLNKLERINEQQAKVHKLKLYPSGTILFAKSGMSAVQNRVFVLPKPAYVVSHLATVEVKNGVDPKFLSYFWQNFKPSNLIQDSAYPSISLEAVGNVEIELPKHDEQKRLAAILDKADRLRRQRRFAQTLSDSFLQSVFIKMFGSLQHENKWKWNKLGAEAEIASGVTKGQNIDGKRTISVPYLRVANVQDGYLDLSEIKMIEALESEAESLKLKQGDILMTEGGDCDKLGRGTIWNATIENCIHQNHIFRVRLNKESIIPSFFDIFLRSNFTKSYFLRCAKQTTNLATINMTQLKELPVPLVPLPLQEKFAEIVQKFERVRRQQREATRQAEHLFQTLLHRAFRGEL